MKVFSYRFSLQTKAKDGKSITKKSEVQTYQVSTDGVTAPTGTWQSTRQAAINAYNTAHDISGTAWAQGTYMWTRTVITWSDLSTTTLYDADYNPKDGGSGVQRWIEISPSDARVTSDGDLTAGITPRVTLWRKQEGSAAHRLTEDECLAESIEVDGYIGTPDGTLYIDENTDISEYFQWNSYESRWEWNSVASSIPAGARIVRTLVVTWYTDSSKTAYYHRVRIGLERQGQEGESPEFLTLQPTPTAVNLHTNAAGEFPSQTVSVACVVKKTVGDIITELDPSDGYPFAGKYYLYWYDEYLAAWQPGVAYGGYDDAAFPSARAVAGYVRKVSFALSTASSYYNVNSSNIVLQTDVPVILDGRRGQTGAAGAGPYPMGYYDSTKEYTRDSLRYPMVLVDDGAWNPVLQCNGHYWYLTADTNVVDGVHYAPVDGSPYWAQADDFGIVITMGLFAKFAKLAGAVVSGDFLYSANGRIGNTEYVNGQTIGDRPAYTRFLGDPSALSGTIQRTSLSGPVQTDRAVLQTVYLAKGTTLNVSITGKTTTSNFYFRIYKKGGDYVTSSVYLYNSERTTTLTHTAIQDGEYTIECYGSSAAVSATFALSWNVTGVFNPNLWLDLLTGAISGARGNFRLDGSGLVEVSGTVRARNLFKTLALSSGGTQQDTVCTVVIAPDGRPERCICVVKNVPESVYDHAFSAGQYLTFDEIDALVNEPGAWEHDYEYFVPCTGPADEVVLVPNTVIGANGYQGYVYLPRCQDYAGKEVTVRHTITSGTATVKQADGAAVFVGSPYLSGYTFSYGSNPESYKSLAAGQTAIFYSTGARWVVLSIW